jgi:NAD(P)-dependent dehydrogenase (short-subunit alcohol dehydrogenase family)
MKPLAKKVALVAGAIRGAGCGIARRKIWRHRVKLAAAVNNAEAKRFGFIHSETPCFVGRAVAALAADTEVARWSGGVYSSWGLSEVYGFTDLDGTRPNIWTAVAESFAQSSASAHAGVQWQLTPVLAQHSR